MVELCCWVNHVLDLQTSLCRLSLTHIWALPGAGGLPMRRHVAKAPPRMPCTNTTSTTGAPACHVHLGLRSGGQVQGVDILCWCCSMDGYQMLATHSRLCQIGGLGKESWGRLSWNSASAVVLHACVPSTCIRGNLATLSCLPSMPLHPWTDQSTHRLLGSLIFVTTSGLKGGPIHRPVLVYSSLKQFSPAPAAAAPSLASSQWWGAVGSNKCTPSRRTTRGPAPACTVAGGCRAASFCLCCASGCCPAACGCCICWALIAASPGPSLSVSLPGSGCSWLAGRCL